LVILKAAAWRLGFGFQNLEPGQKPSQAVTLAWLGLAQFGLAHSLRLEQAQH
jgi:hypothetical protein